MGGVTGRRQNVVVQHWDLVRKLHPSARGSPPNFVSFAFGALLGWDQFSVYLLAADGRVCQLCPIVPNGSSLPFADIKVLEEEVDRRLARAKVKGRTKKENQYTYQKVWLQETWLHGNPRVGDSCVARTPTAEGLRSPALQGPAGEILSPGMPRAFDLLQL